MSAGRTGAAAGRNGAGEAPRTRSRAMVVLAAVACAGLQLLSFSQPWFEWTIAGASEPVQVTGQQAAAAGQALALVSLACAGVLSLLRPIGARICGGLLVFSGGVTLVAAWRAFSDPLGSSQSALAKATGVAGRDALESMAQLGGAAGWAWTGIVASVLVMLVGGWTIIVAGRWRFRGKSRFSASSEPRSRDDDGTGIDAVEQWDELSRGVDPTDAASRTDRA